MASLSFAPPKPRAPDHAALRAAACLTLSVWTLQLPPFLAAAITGTVTLAAALGSQGLGYFLRKRDARAERLRSLRLDRIRDAERTLVIQLDVSAAIAERDLLSARRLVQESKGLGHADPLLVGDLEVVKAWAKACGAVMSRIPTHPAAGLRVWLVGVSVPRHERAAIGHARSDVLAAFDRQRELAILDRPVARLDKAKADAALEEIAEVQAFVARFGQPNEPAIGPEPTA